jgi:hypothetical protein
MSVLAFLGMAALSGIGAAIAVMVGFVALFTVIGAVDYLTRRPLPPNPWEYDRTDPRSPLYRRPV